MDLDAYEFDTDSSADAALLREGLRGLIRHPCVLVPYRPLAFLSEVSYPGRSVVEVFGLFAEQQRAFEHKPWVERGLHDAGIPTIPWTYYEIEERERLLEAVHDKSWVLRAVRSSGGSGLAIVREPSDADRFLSRIPNGFVALAPLLEPNLPINVGGCVFADGSVSVHTPSVQLIGIPGCTRNSFGYCGNDFARIRTLADDELVEIESVTVAVGKWLAGHGYLGAFGIDALLFDARVLVAEVNPRFQGSSEVSSRVDAAAGDVDLYQAHLSAFLGIPAPLQTPLVDRAKRQLPLAQILIHNLASSPQRDAPWEPPSVASGLEVQLRPRQEVEVAPGGILMRIVSSSSVTVDGHSVAWASLGMSGPPVARTPGGLGEGV